MSGDIPVKQAKPEWLKVRAPGGENFLHLKDVLKQHHLHTVCEEARCPNIGECWAGGTATFMILGDTCTRGCKFCAVTTGNPKGKVDELEPQKIASVVRDMKLKYIVLTSVDRDDLEDQGSGHFAKTVQLTKMLSPNMIIEVLTPDWRGDERWIAKTALSGADVLAHNIETVRRLQRKVRDPRATYEQSLQVLKRYGEIATDAGKKVLTKSSIMVGLGESEEETLECMQDLYNAGVRILTLGQYLQPTKRHLPVVNFATPEYFSRLAKAGEDMGYAYVASGPLVRSSYRAGEYFIERVLHGLKSQGEIMQPQAPEKQKEVIQAT